MLGAVLGDIVGSRFEWNNIKSTNFDLLTPECRITDDSVMTLAVAKAVYRVKSGQAARESLGDEAAHWMRAFGNRWAKGSYGGRFAQWLKSGEPHPYGSFGNGSAMRVSACAWAGDSLEDALDMARRVTEVTHDHPEGIKGAEAVAEAIWMARAGESESVIRKTLEQKYYALNFTLDAIRPAYRFDVSCQGSVPQALCAFLESSDYESAIRNAISLGGDSDTLAAMAGSVAEAAYGIPEYLREEALIRLPQELQTVVREFELLCPARIV